FQAEDGIRDFHVTGVQTCALPIWEVRVCDPLRQAREVGDFVSLDEIVETCDVISLHTPLTLDGEHATFHLFDQTRLEQLRPGSWLINASRGAVVDNAALREQLARRPDIQAVLDVWEGEPQIGRASCRESRRVAGG